MNNANDIPTASAAPRPIPLLERTRAYAAPAHGAPIDLRLDANEGPAPDGSILDALAGELPELLRSYPSVRTLEALLAERVGVAPEQLMVTAGADDALDRACRAVLAPGRELILPVPTFEMIERWADLADGRTIKVAWPAGPLPVDVMLEAVTPETAMIAVVTPNNPTGAVATADDLRRLSEAAPHAMLLVDLAYEEFASEPLTGIVRALPNAIGVRTLSKAWGLAGLRIGYAFGAERMIGWLRAVGGPFPVAAPAAAIAARWLEAGAAYVCEQVGEANRARASLERTLMSLGADVLPSQANFAAARVRNPSWVRDALAGLGIGVRVWPTRQGCEDLVRITSPQTDAETARVERALTAALRPEAILFDLDGVLADVSRSYRTAIIETAAAFGVTLTADDVRAAKRLGNANNDWVLTHRLIEAAGVRTSLDAVTERFETIYQGTGSNPGLRRTETLLCDPDWLRGMSDRLPLAIVTGRPRADAEIFLVDHGVRHHFREVIAMEDGPAKPDPAVVRLAMTRLGVRAGWMVGDTVDDVRAARGAGVVPIGVCAPGEQNDETVRTLQASGTGRVLQHLEELESLLP
ncbi:MAG: TIGR01548 family HAD-type hydrolase [Phycisphaerales bacterium]|nr:MAG: TIGR01548 family HAD-type hydrolase [Phycisphaerales bacterium]